jgi:hypothetical protein
MRGKREPNREESADDYGDDYGLREKTSRSSIVVVAVVIHRNGRENGGERRQTAKTL